MNRPITAKADPQTARAYWTMGRGESARAFQAARRHSRMVRTLRVAVPAFIGIVVVAMVLITYLNPLRMLTKLPINVGDLVVSGTKITMEHPHLSGFTKDARAYELSAEAAAQDMTKPDVVELHNIQAKLQMQDKSTVEMKAALGIYNSKGEMLNLQRNIDLASSTGYAGHLIEAMVDIRAGNVFSEKPVEVKLLQGVLNSNGLRIENSGDLVRFEGGVTMTLMLNQSASPAADSAQQQNKAGAR
ncbi:MAG TPA: LPS export ABC transporter periplasmic protein LptC [Pseudolabrys sp.]|nr:LPS export ABC transporter periplasmic protein LptC [Pseudolabrys sp.]